MKRFSTSVCWHGWLSGILLAGICLSMISAPVAARVAAESSSPASFQAFFDAALQQQMTDEHIAGATVAVVQNGGLAFTKGYGYADLEAGVPVQADQTLFFIGSDGKLFTWTAVMQLAGQGKLDLHADVNTYLDFEIPAAFDGPVTLHHLMTHTAGFEDDYTSLLMDDPGKILPLREHLVRHMPARVYPPGSVSAYSNYGTALAGYIIERVSGQPYETYLVEHMLQPLGMKHSFVGNALPDEMAADLSKGYKYQNDGFNGLDFEWTAAVPCAAIRTTVTDLSRFMIAHLNDGCVDGACILPSDMVELMHRPQFTHHPQMSGMAYGFLDMEFNGQRVLWHMGESARFITILALIPEQNLGLVVSYNTPPADGRDILFLFMDTFFPDNRPSLDQQPLAGWETRAARFNGTYAPARSAQTTPQIVARNTMAAAVAVDQGRLTFNGWKFVETEPGLFRQVDGSRVLVFEEDANGQRWLFVGPLAYFQLPWYQTSGFLLSLLGGILLIFLSAWIAGLIAAFRRSKRFDNSGRVALWLASGLGLYYFGLLAWFLSLMLAYADNYVYPQEAVRIVAALSWLAVPWTFAVLGFALRAWLRGAWSLARRMHYSLVALAAAAFLWLLWSLNLFGGRV